MMQDCFAAIFNQCKTEKKQRKTDCKQCDYMYNMLHIT